MRISLPFSFLAFSFFALVFLLPRAEVSGNPETILSDDTDLPEETDAPVRWLFEPDPVADSPYRVAIGDTEFPLYPAGHLHPAYYARFQVKKSFTFEIDVDLPDNTRIVLLPTRYQDDLSIDEGRLSLRIDGPGQRVLMMDPVDGDRHSPLILLAEADRDWGPEIEGREVFDVSPLADHPSGDAVTEELQAVLNACSARDDGGLVIFGPGTYRTSPLMVGSNTEIFLAPGALVYADTSDWPDRWGAVFRFWNAENSGLSGPGVIDGRGHLIRGAGHERSGRVVHFRHGKRLFARDVMMRDAAGWVFHVIHCDDIEIDGIRIVADWGVPNTDGIDPDHARDVRISNVFVYSGDDAIVVKATSPAHTARPSTRIVVRDSVVMSLKTALKIGTESRRDIRDILFENIDVIHSSRGIGLWMRDGHAFSNIVFRDIRMDLHEFEGESMSGEPFRITIRDRTGTGSIQNVVIENVEVTAPYRAIISGWDDGWIEDLVLRAIHWTVRPARIKTSPLRPGAPDGARPEDLHRVIQVRGRPLWTVNRTRDLLLENVTIDWTAAPDSWDRFLDRQETSDLRFENLRHIAYPFDQ